MRDLTQALVPDDSSFFNPFSDIVFSDQTPLPGNPEVHQTEMARCVRLIEQKVALTRRVDTPRSRGELITISAPTAGFGKTHLINRISSEVLNRVSVLDLSLEPQTDWAELLSSTSQQLETKRSVEHSSTLSKIDEVGAFFLAHLINSAIKGEIIDKLDCPSPISVRKEDFFLAFGGGTNSKIYTWLNERLDNLANLVALPDHYFEGFTRSDISFWGNYFIAYFQRDNQRLMNLTNGLSIRDARKRTIQLLRLSSILSPILIIVDHLDACHGSELAGFEVATIVTSISESLPNSVLIFSINEDLWLSVFQDKLPSALRDRMESGENLELEPINADQACDIVNERLTNNGIPHQLAYQFSQQLSELHNWRNSKHELHPRKIIKQAMKLWESEGEQYSPPSIPKTEVEKSKPLFDFQFLNSPNQTKDNENTVLRAFSNPVEEKPPVETIQPTHENVNSIWTSSNRSISPALPKTSQDLPAGRLAPKDSPKIGESYNQPTTNLADNEPSESEGPAAATSSDTTESTIREDSDTEKRSNAYSKMAEYFDQLEEHFLKRKEYLTIDLSIFEILILNVGRMHEPLEQTELYITGGESNCANWNLTNQSVYIGFESAQNLFFYSNLLQKITCLHSQKKTKIVCFTHESEPFNSDLLTIHGFDRESLRNTFDFIQLSNEELALAYAGAKFFKETINKNCAPDGLKIVLKRLNPLWQRICKTV